MISPTTWMIRQQALQRYGGTCMCPCGCRESDLRVLQVDHVNGGGNREREDLRGLRFATRLVNEPIRDDLRLLCANCHVRITLHGGCTEELPKEINEKENMAEASTQEEESGGQPPGVQPMTFPWMSEATFAADDAARQAAESTPSPSKRGWRLWS